jgi:hypothetical protein
MKKINLALIILLLSSLSSSAQLKERDHLIGGTLGFWPKQNVPTFGFNYEYQVTQAGIGSIGIGGLFRYYTYGYAAINRDSWRYSFSTFGFQGNYNFNEIGNGSFVPFFGLVLGYNYVNSTYTDVRGNTVYISDVTYRSGAWIWAQTGFRYFFSPRVAGALRLGLGNFDFNTLELGIDFKL